MTQKGHPHPRRIENLQLAFILNLGFAIFELVGGFWTNSLSLVAGALHDLGDSATLGVSWYLENISRREEDNQYSYGYRRFSLLGAVISAIVLILGAIFVVVEAVPRLIHPEHSNAQGMIVFAVIGICVNGIAVLCMRSEKSMNARMISWHLLDDVLGWGAVLVMSLVLLFADIHILDPIFSLLITAFVLFNVIKNLRKTLSLFLQAVPEEVEIETIVNAIKRAQKVKDVHHTHLWSLDGEHNVLTTHVVLEEGASRNEIRAIKCLVHEMVPKYDLAHTTIEFEYLDEDCSMNHLHENEKNMNDTQDVKTNFLNKPLSMRGWPTWLVILTGIIGMGYILNPGLGIFELIPDSFPIVGNLDEGAAAMAIWYGLLELFEMHRRRKDNLQS